MEQKGFYYSMENPIYDCNKIVLWKKNENEEI